MTPEEKLRGAIGLSMKAGKCQSGDFQVERALKRGGIVLVLLDAACSEATRERYTALCGKRGIPLLTVREAGDWIGKPSRKILGVTDDNFKRMIMDAYDRVERNKTGGMS